MNDSFGAASAISSSWAGPVPSRTGVRSMITVTCVSPLRECLHTCSSTPIVVTPSERSAASIRIRLAFGHDGVVRGVPGDPEPLGDPSHRQVLNQLNHYSFQNPPQSGAGSAAAARRRGWCLGATPVRSRCTCTGGSRPAAWPVAGPAARGTAGGSRCRAVPLRSRNGDTSPRSRRRYRRPGRPELHGRVRGAGRRLRVRGRRAGSTRSGQDSRSPSFVTTETVPTGAAGS